MRKFLTVVILVGIAVALSHFLSSPPSAIVEKKPKEPEYYEAHRDPDSLTDKKSFLSLPALKTQKKLTVTELENLVHNNQLCSVMTYLSQPQSDLSKTQVNNVFLRNMKGETPAEYSEFLEDQNPYSTTVSMNYSSRPARFVLALRLGNLMIGGSPIALDYAKAWDLLFDLEKEDSENMAYPFFRLAVEDEMGRRNDPWSVTEETFSNKTYFDTLYIGYMRAMNKAMRANLTDFVMGATYLSSLPTPNYAKAKQVFEKSMPPTVQISLGVNMVLPSYEARASHWLFGYSFPELVMGNNLMQKSSQLRAKSARERLREVETAKIKPVYEWEDFALTPDEFCREDKRQELEAKLERLRQQED